MKQLYRYLLISLTLITTLCVENVSAQKEDDIYTHKLRMAEYLINHFYVDEVDRGKLVEEAIIKMVSQLDPHSYYMSAEEVKKAKESLGGNFEGIGVQFNMIEDTLLVIQPISNGPSEKVGILAGDRIVAVDDTAIAGVKMSTEEIMNRLRGPKDSKVNLTIVRRGASEPLIFTVKRDRIPIYSLDASYLIEPAIGYIRINRFGATTTEEFNQALKQLKKKGARDLILDLQGNGGGYLNAAIDMVNDFLDSEELIVYTEGRGYKRSDFLAKGNGKFKTGRLVVLIDEYSASASEIVSGAVQDWDRGVIVGRRSFGKGLVQRQLDLIDGAAIRLTVARYYTPAGRSIQKPYNSSFNSNTSDEENRQSYAHELIDRYNNGEMLSADSVHFPDSLKHETLKLGRTVYGGGGIMPDYFVPVDTSYYSSYYGQLWAKGVVIKTTINYIENHREELKLKYKKFETFQKQFEVTDEILNTLKNLATQAGVEFQEEQYNTSLPLLKTQLKAYIARDLWGMNEYFRIMNEHNETVVQALKIIRGNEYLKILK